MPDEEERADKPWVVRDVSEQVRRAVKVYAARHDLTMARALEEMVAAGQTAPSEAELEEFNKLLREFKLAEKITAGKIAEIGTHTLANLWLERFQATDPEVVDKVREFAARRHFDISKAMEVLLEMAVVTTEVRNVLWEDQLGDAVRERELRAERDAWVERRRALKPTNPE